MRGASARPSLTASGFRQILAVLGALGAAGIAAELALIGHWHGAVQLVAFGAVVLLVAGALIALWAPNRGALIGVRVISVVVCGAGVVGGLEHVEQNRAFASELHSDWSPLRLWWAGLDGRIPGLAPLVLAHLALLVACSTIGHPNLQASNRSASAAVETQPHLSDTICVDFACRSTALASRFGLTSGWVLAAAVMLAAVEWRLAAVALVSLPLLGRVSAEHTGWIATVVVATLGGARFQAGLLSFGGLLTVVVATKAIFVAIGNHLDALTAGDDATEAMKV